jgi:hypothetical protein
VSYYSTKRKANVETIRKTFDNIPAAMAFFHDRCEQGPICDWRWNGIVTNNNKQKKAERIVDEGDPKIVEALRKAIENAPNWIFEQGHWQQTQNMPYGSTPIVGAYLAGNPCCMRHKVRRQSPEPVRIYWEMTTSAGINHQTIIESGCLIAAIAQALGRSRPVEVWACCHCRVSGKDIAIKTRLGTTPLDLGSLSTAIHTCYHRWVNYRIAAALAGSRYETYIQWPIGETRAAYELNERDLLIGSRHLNNVSDLQANVEQWLESQGEVVRGG